MILPNFWNILLCSEAARLALLLSQVPVVLLLGLTEAHVTIMPYCLEQAVFDPVFYPDPLTSGGGKFVILGV
jgi:hypothetical protein